MINRLWWIDPGNVLALVVLPVFVMSAIIGGPYMPQFGTSNFLTPAMITLGAVCVIVMASAAKVGMAVTSRQNPQHLTFDRRLYDLLLVAFLVVTLVAYALLLGPLLADPANILDVLSGEMGAVYVAKREMGKLVGVTTLTNLAPLVACMCSVRFLLWGRFLPSRGTLMLAAFLPFFILVHAFIGAERIVLMENAIAFMLPLFSFWDRLRAVGRYAPFLGAAAGIIIFAVGEFQRSWPYHSGYYDSFAQFAGLRLLGYVAVASNTGAGMVTTMPPVGYPLITARWVTKLPFFDTSQGTYQDQYLQSFGNIEFNNPGGIMAPLVDFGIPIGLVVLLLFGILLGFIYGLYRNRHPVGLLAYPIFFVGLVDLTQIWFWGEPRFLPRLIFLAIAILIAVRRPVLRHA